MGLLSKALKYKKGINGEPGKNKEEKLSEFIDDLYSAPDSDQSGLNEPDQGGIGTEPGQSGVAEKVIPRRRDFEVIDEETFVFSGEPAKDETASVLTDDGMKMVLSGGESESELDDEMRDESHEVREAAAAQEEIDADEDAMDDIDMLQPNLARTKERPSIVSDRITHIIEDSTPPGEEMAEFEELHSADKKIDVPEQSGSEYTKSGADGLLATELPPEEIKPRRRIERRKLSSDTDDEDLGPEDIPGDELKFSDFMVLYEIQKEIARANTTDELYDVILFSLMGQIGASSSSIMVRSPKNVGKWIIVKSIGVTIENEDLYFNPASGILQKLFEKKEIIDIDEFKNDPSLIDEYYKYISIDGKLLVPLLQGFEILGAVILGEKLDSGEFSEEDMDFLHFIGEVSAIALNNINTMEMIMKVNENLSRDFGYIRDVDRFKKKIFHNMSLGKIEADIQNEFDQMGITGYTVFSRGMDEKSFTPLITDRNDFLKIKDLKYTIKDKSGFIKYMNKPESPVTIENPRESDILSEIFSIEQLLKIFIFRIYPYIIGNEILGFILVYKISDEAVLDEIDKKLSRIAEFIFAQVQNIQHVTIRHSNYIDNIELIFNRIDEEIVNSKNLGIPLTIVMMSIKNHKRYYNLLGAGPFQKLLDGFEEVIKKRLSDNDFSIRYGRHKILIVLPGKDKKYASPLANSISNEIISTFNSREIQLLITSLSAEYPSDGLDLNTLIDIIDY